MSTVIFIEPAMHHLLHEWEGPTGKFIARKANELETKARVVAPVDTGKLLHDISVRKTETLGELEAQIGDNPGGSIRGYAYFQHEGTRPHEIRARTGKVLKFSQRGMTMYRKRVWHPGTRPLKYLSRFLKDVI